MNYDEKLKLLQVLKQVCKEDNNFFSEAVNYMQQGVNEKIEDLNKKVVSMECIAVAMHSKASDSRHTEKSKAWVDGIIDRYGDVNHATNIKWDEKL